MRKVLKKNFFNRPTLLVAQDLLGKFLVRKRNGRVVAAMITEVEAYDGPKDKASHGARGRNKRSEMMFGPPGYWFIYLTYGIHWMLNVVTGPKDYPAAVLIRGVEGINGPGRVTKKLGVNGGFINETVSVKTGLWIEDRGVWVDKKLIKKTPRIGIAHAGPYWAKKKYRFTISY
mgnify:CR=1 FL=1